MMPMRVRKTLPGARRLPALVRLVVSVAVVMNATRSCRLVVADHKLDTVFVVALAEAAAADSAFAADSWLASTAAQVSRLAAVAAAGHAAATGRAAQASRALASATDAMPPKQYQQMQPLAAGNGHLNGTLQQAHCKAVAPTSTSMPAATAGCEPKSAARHGPDPDLQLRPKHSKAQYLRNVCDCLQVGFFDTDCFCRLSLWPTRPAAHHSAHCLVNITSSFCRRCEMVRATSCA